MKLYEVVYSGIPREGGPDIAFLVRAPDFLSAVFEVTNNGGIEVKDCVARSVHEIGIEVTLKELSLDELTRILRGPYYTRAYNYGWRRWDRRIVGFNYVDEWDEVV